VSPDYRDLIAGNIPPWVRRIIKQAGRTINRFDMIRGDERILLGISGGKDSLVLALALALRQTWMPVSYRLEALHINWDEHPLDEAQTDALREFFHALAVPFTSVTASMRPDSFKGEFNCYLCSRNRRRILFDAASERGIRQIALGHHLDDLVETSLINLCFRGDFSTMLPVQDFFGGSLYVIRPLIEIREHAIARLSEAFSLPAAKPVCPYDQTNIRSQLKPIVRELCRIDRLTREHIFNAHAFSCRIVRSEFQPHTAPPHAQIQDRE
jgi:tRNA 2-thiocytidine biosynthesis protein TtcA